MQLKTKLYRSEDILNIAGVNEKNLNVFNELYQVMVSIRGEHIYLDSKDELMIKLIEDTFDVLLKISNKNIFLAYRDVLYIATRIKEGFYHEILDLYVNRKIITTNISGKPIYAKTLNQINYLKAIEENDLIISVGCAGTGKTYLAVVVAIKLLKEGLIKKIILTRPAVEAGESLGFLPGDLREKIDPYLKPLYDALYEMLGFESTENYIEKGLIEIAPLAYMRGRTLDNAFVILDEAQNTTRMQMKMFLSRLGFNSKMIVTGDISQTDLPKGESSGLKHSIKILKDIQGIKIVEFSGIDIIRHPLVQKILERYETDENQLHKSN